MSRRGGSSGIFQFASAGAEIQAPEGLKRPRMLIMFSAILILALAASGTPAAAKKYGRVAGVILDGVNKTPIPHANVMLENTSLGAVSGKNGYFNIERVPPGAYHLIVTMLGYRKMIVKGVLVQADGVRAVRVALNRQNIEMGNVQVQAKREAQTFEYEKSIAGHEIITPRFIARRPGALEDAYRALNVLPGVTARSDLNTQLYIRGGSPDQNLILYDGIEITTPSRLFIIMGGGISLVNPDIIQGIDLEPAGFDAANGGKTSALLQIANREGRRDRLAVSSSLAMVTARAVAEGPIGKKRGSWLIAGRRSFYDLLANQLYDKNYIFPYYYDLHAKAAYDVARDSRLTAFYTHLGEGAKMFNVESEQLDLLNSGKGHIAGLRFNTLFSPRAMLNLLLGYYEDRNDIKMFDTYNARYHVDLEYAVQRRTARAEFVYSPRPWFSLKSGAQASNHHTGLSLENAWRNNISFVVTDSMRFTIRSEDIGAFTQLRLQPQSWLELSAGMRYDYSSRYNEFHWHPRTKLLFFPKKPVNFWLSYGTYSQYPDVLTVIGRGEPLDISRNPEQIGAERAEHRIIGLQWAPTPKSQLKVELYQKQMNDLLVNPSELPPFIPENSGGGQARGVEFSFQRLRQGTERFGWWANMALAEAKYKRFAADPWRYFDYDQRLQASAGGELRMGKRWQLSAIAHYSSGFPYTPILAIQRDVEAPRDPLYNYRIVNRAENSARYPYYLRCDLRLSYVRASPRSTFSAYLDLINILNRRNIYMYDWRYTKSSDDSDGYVRRNVVYMLPFLPSFGVSIAF